MGHVASKGGTAGDCPLPGTGMEWGAGKEGPPVVGRPAEREGATGFSTVLCD